MLSAIAAQARRTNLSRAAELQEALDRAAADELDGVGVAAAEQTAHQLAGSAGTFGFAGVSERARYLERFFARAALHGPGAVGVDEARRVLQQATDQLAGEPDPD